MCLLVSVTHRRVPITLRRVACVTVCRGGRISALGTNTPTHSRTIITLPLPFAQKKVGSAASEKRCRSWAPTVGEHQCPAIKAGQSHNKWSLRVKRAQIDPKVEATHQTEPNQTDTHSRRTTSSTLSTSRIRVDRLVPSLCHSPCREVVQVPKHTLCS